MLGFQNGGTPLFGILLGVIVLIALGITVFFIIRFFIKLTSRRQQPTQKISQNLAQHEFQVKICPTCKRSYSDVSLNFCLDDGVLLSNTLSVQSHHDLKETLFYPRGR